MSNTTKLSEVLANVDNHCLVDICEALNTLLIYITNVLANPAQKKFRKVRISNIHYQERVGHIDPKNELLSSVGFSKDGDFMVLDNKLYASQSTEDYPELLNMRQMVRDKLNSLKEQLAHIERKPPDSHHWTSVKGVSAHDDIGTRATMEDEFIVIDGFNNNPKTGFFGLFDGHGGRDSVEFVVRALHLNLEKEVRDNPKKPILSAFKDVYLKTDGQVRRQRILQSGTTAVTVLIREEGNKRKMYVGNVGDSRAVLCRGNKAIRLTKDHKAIDPDEAKRIVDQGGYVGRFNRVNGILAISRALGDHMLKDVVSAVPYCTEYTLTDDDKFLILACDGVWDVIEEQPLIEHLLGRLKEAKDSISNPKDETEELISSCGYIPDLAREICEMSIEKKTQDNVTCCVVWL